MIGRQNVLQEEVDWINYLAEGGVSVARAIRSETGKLVEAVEDGQAGHFLVTAFVKAQGQPPWDVWTPALYKTYGRLLGTMHALAGRYHPAELAWKRPDWDDDSMEFVSGFDITRTLKYKNVRRGNAKVALVIDDLESVTPWKARGIKIHGTAEIVEGQGQKAHRSARKMKSQRDSPPSWSRWSKQPIWKAASISRTRRLGASQARPSCRSLSSAIQ